MQEGGKIAVAASVTFLAGVVTGWVLNTYTRKGLEKFLSSMQTKVKSL